MELTFEQLSDKIKGCWHGKNIGGVLGAPFEGLRQVNDVNFYVQDLSGDPPPNDDLDLQLVWLNAVEKFGRGVNASILGDYWLSYVIPDWVEYGSGKYNLRAGLQPPVSGYIGNLYRNSCGCFIRSEIWACLAPGHPEIAARYAYEDAIVDHAEEGMYAEVFCAAVQSAAFVEGDLHRLLEIGLSYIPSGCAVAKAIGIVVDAYNEKVPFTEARKRVLAGVPGNFGIQNTPLCKIKDDFEHGTPGFDAPSNIGIMLIGWLYGEGDFGKSLCIAVNCGEDTDCTAATLGAIFGIIRGESGLPKEWVEPIDGVITTCCINELAGLPVPKSVDELSDRVLREIPAFMGRQCCDIMSGKGFTFKTKEADELMCPPHDQYIPMINGLFKPKELPMDELLALSPHAVKFDFSTFYVVVDYLDDPYITVGQPRRVKLSVYDNGITNHQHWVNVTLYTPEGVLIPQGKRFGMPLQTLYQYKAEFEFDICVETIFSERVEILADISLAGRHTNGIVKFMLYPKCGNAAIVQQ